MNLYEMLHLSYKLDVMKCGERMTEEDKASERNRKKQVQDKFGEELHLLVDMLKANFGSSKDGNTARAVFRAFERSAVILGVDERIIRGLFNLCQMINSHRKINAAK